MHNIEIDNSSKNAIRGKKWSNPGASFYDEICYDDDVLKEAYLVVGKLHNDPRSKTPFSRSGCKYPHHSLVGNKLVLNENGIKAAYSRIKQMGLFKGKIKEHLIRHYKELGIYEGSTMNADSKMMENFTFIESYIGICESSESFKNMPIKDIIKWMNCIKYDDNDTKWKLKSPSELEKTKIGNCHDQSLFLYNIMKERGYDCGQLFFIEFNTGDDVGGKTHTLTWIKEGGKYYWLEHAWDKFIGVNGPYDSLEAIKNDVHTKWEKTSDGSFEDIMFATVSNYQIGMDMAEYVSSWDLSDLDKLEDQMEWVESVIYSSFMEANEPPEIDELGNEDETKDAPNADEADATEESEGDDITEEPLTSDEVAEEPSKADVSVDPTDDSIPEDSKVNNPEDGVDQPDDEQPTEDNENPVDDVIEEEPKSLPKQTDAAEGDKNGVNRKKLYIAFIEWCKEYNNKNTFGSVFDKDIFHNVYPFVPHEMRYFYRLANPILCVLAGDLTFFQVSELKAINEDNDHLDKMMIFAATPKDLRVFSTEDKKVYRAVEENGEIIVKGVLGNSFDLYLQTMIGRGNILDGEVEGKEDNNV